MTPGDEEKRAYSKRQVDRAGRAIAARAAADADAEGLAAAPDLDQAARIVAWWRDQHEAALAHLTAELRRHTGTHDRAVVSGRIKRSSAIVAKLAREPTMRLSRMGDVGGLRVVLPGQRSADDLTERLMQDLDVRQARDYVADPKPNGYRAIHLIVHHDDRLIEVQLRTPGQDEWANLVDRLSRSVAPTLKFGGGPPALRRYLKIAADILAAREAHAG